MWIEICDQEGNYLGAVNSEACDLIRLQSGPKEKAAEQGALIRNISSNEVYLTVMPYKLLCSLIAASSVVPMNREQRRLITP
jgi:hypothetical protein